MAEDTTVIDALGGVTYYQYEGAYVTSVKDPLGREATHDGLDSDTDPAGRTTYYHYADGQVVYSGDAEGYGTYYQYGPMWIDFRSAESDALGNTRYYEYRCPGQVVWGSGPCFPLLCRSLRKAS